MNCSRRVRIFQKDAKLRKFAVPGSGVLILVHVTSPSSVVRSVELAQTTPGKD
jgi:hypothetical protein